jgi:hypothetical protein
MPHLRVTKAEMGEIEETEDFQLPPEEDVKVEEDIPSSEESEPSSEEDEPKVAPGPPVGLPPPPQFAPPPAKMPVAPPSLDAGATEGEKTPSVEELPSKFYKVLWEYKNEEGDADTLTLQVGDILIVLETRADGWWKGQSGDQVGVFPVAYCEPVGEEEVKAFIMQTSAKKSPVAAAGGGTPSSSRAELEREMKELQAEQAALSAQSKALKEEVAGLKDEARKLRKKTREELLELFDSLPPALYQIPMFSNIQNDLVRCALHIGRILDIESDHKELLPDTILICSTFVDEGPKTLAAEPKLKADLDKVVTKVLAIQKFLIDEHANTNVELPRNVMNLLELLALRVHAYVHGEIDMTQAKTTELAPLASPKQIARIAVDEIVGVAQHSPSPDTPSSKKRSKSTKNSSPSAEESAAPQTSAEAEETPVSPREKKKKKKDRTTSLAPPVEDEDAEENGKETKEKEKKKKRRDKDGLASPRKSKMVDQAELANQTEESPVSPRSKDKKSKKKKVDEEVPAATEGEE